MGDSSEEKDFCIDRAKTGRAVCKKCKQKCESGVLRLAKLVPNHFADNLGKLKNWFHIDCIFESFKKARATTKKIESIDDIDGIEILTEEERDDILEKIYSTSGCEKPKKTEKKVQPKLFPSSARSASFPSTSTGTTSTKLNYLNNYNEESEDNLFRTFCKICDKIGSVSGYKEKSYTLQTFFIRGSNGKRFEGNMLLWLQMMLPSAVKRIYNLQSKQLIKLFSRIFRTDHQDMLIDLEQGDVAETIRKYFECSKHVAPQEKSNLTLEEVDKFLENLTKLTKEDDQIDWLEKFIHKCNADDLKMIIRLIKHDLRINAGARHILDALHSTAYTTFQSSRDLEMVVSKFGPLIIQNKINLDGSNKLQSGTGGGVGGGTSTKTTGGVQLMSPISPMLAEACKSVEKAISKNPEGVYSEIKYDGERVQIHKRGNEFKFFSRSLKPVMEHKITQCKEFIPKAFPSGQDMILDSEIILVNTDNGALLPFGTLGVHRKGQLESTEVCLFVFDCIYLNGEDLTKKSLLERKNILKENIKPIKHHVELSEYYLLKTVKELASMTAKVLKSNLEGLVLKNIKGTYQPGKRGWLKIKKDYLFEGQMADSADLVVLGAWFGTGKKGGMLSIFLMGCYDKKVKLWKTVTKVHSGLDDNTMEGFQDEFKELMHRANPDNPPSWILCKKQLIPDFIANDPFKMPVWEITGAEFTQAEVHTANGISIRFPRITKIREDKSTLEATSLKELETLLKKSKDHANIDRLFKGIDLDENIIDIKTKFFDPTITSYDTSIDIKKPIKKEKQIENDESDESLPRQTAGSKEKNSKRKINLDMKGDASEMKDTKSIFSINKKIKTEKHIKEETITKPLPIKKEIKTECFSEDDIEQQVPGKSSEYSQSNVKQKWSTEKTMNATTTTTTTTKQTEFVAKKEFLEIFNGIKLYIQQEVDEQFKPVRKRFKKWGGEITDDSLEATHALHFYEENKNDFLVLRKLYQPQCRHINYNWILESIGQEKLLPVQRYAVCL